ncbi:serine hydrolase [Patescibacteria group bacterium]|nr:serine hydrolase [Patescibacteria group bacterium]
MNKYLTQILVVLIMLVIAWGLFSLGKDNNDKPIEASVQQTAGDIVLPSRFPINEEYFPIRNWSVEEPEINAESGIILNIKKNGKQTILFDKNKDDVLPIASLTKIMTAIIVLENFDLEQIIKISKESVSVLGDKGGLIRGEELKVKDLLHIMLIESSNDAATALVLDGHIGYKEFIDLMNQKAKDLNLKNTYFIDPAGLSSQNISSVIDLANLTQYTLNYPILWNILETSEIQIYSIDNKFVHSLKSTNILLDMVNIGKTGYTNEAKGCMLTASNIQDNYLITVVLGSDQREEDTKTLITWAKQAYLWQ